jgi:hypothetical protein
VDVDFMDSRGVSIDRVERALNFNVLNVAPEGNDHYPWQHVRGAVRPESEWAVAEQPAAVEATDPR